MSETKNKDTMTWILKKGERKQHNEELVNYLTNVRKYFYLSPI